LSPPKGAQSQTNFDRSQSLGFAWVAGGGPRRLGQPSSSPYGANRNVVTALGKPKARLRSANPVAPLPEAERMAASKFGSLPTGGRFAPLHGAKSLTRAFAQRSCQTLTRPVGARTYAKLGPALDLRVQQSRQNFCSCSRACPAKLGCPQNLRSKLASAKHSVSRASTRDGP
jgi:hypothetical protein